MPAADRERVVQDALAAALASAGVLRAQAGVNAKRTHRYFASTEGSRQEQHFVESGGMVLALAGGEQLVQRRSYPNSFHGNTAAAGWEYVTGLRLPRGGGPGRRGGGPAAHRPGGRAGHRVDRDRAGPARPADPRVDRARARAGPDPGRRGQLRRALVHRADAAGTLQYGSPAVNVVADATVPGTRGSFAFDDEGTPTRRTMLITEGLVTNFLSSRDSAARIGAASTAAARSDGWGFLPLCFATNVFLEPASGSLDELLDRMGDGYYLDDNKSWSIDSQRLNFQFGTEVAWEVRRGKRTRLLRDFSYGGITPQFWGSMEATAGPAEFRTFGMPCGKGEPKEWGFLSHGAAPSLFRNVAIGVA